MRNWRPLKRFSELARKQRELDDAKRELELTVETRVQHGLNAVRVLARQEAEESLKLKVMEKDQTIASMQQKIEELKRRAEQGSQQLQGEVQELALENLLRVKFPFNSIDPVPKGDYGGDVLTALLERPGNPGAPFYGRPNVPENGAIFGWLNCERTSVPLKRKSP